MPKYLYPAQNVAQLSSVMSVPDAYDLPLRARALSASVQQPIKAKVETAGVISRVAVGEADEVVLKRGITATDRTKLVNSTGRCRSTTTLNSGLTRGR